MGKDRRCRRMLIAGVLVLLAVVGALSYWRAGNGEGISTSSADGARERPVASGRIDAARHPPLGGVQADGDATPSSVARAKTNEEALAEFMQELMDERNPDRDVPTSDLIQQMVSEERDVAWATDIESSIQAALRISHEEANDAADVRRIQCGETLCVVQAVNSPTALDTVAEWPGVVNSLSEGESPHFVTTRTSAKVLRDGRVLYVTVLVR